VHGAGQNPNTSGTNQKRSGARLGLLVHQPVGKFKAKTAPALSAAWYVRPRRTLPRASRAAARKKNQKTRHQETHAMRRPRPALLDAAAREAERTVLPERTTGSL